MSLRNAWNWGGLALLFLLVGTLRHYLWPAFPAEQQGMVSKGLGGVAILFLLLIATWRARRPLILVALWWAWEETQVVLCSIAYIHSPWTVPPGIGICSAKIGLDLGAFGIVVVAALLLYLTRVGSSKTWHGGRK